jgi:hypothetical protein
MPPLSSIVNPYGARSGWGGTPDARTAPAADDWFAQQGIAPGTDAWYAGHTVGQGTPAAPGQFTGAQGTPGASGDASWWNPQDPKGSLDRLFQGQPPSSQTILAHAPQLQAAGIEISPPNAEGVTSKIHIPGVGWTRILEGGVAGGAGTGWNYVPQGTTGPGGTINMDGSPAGGGGIDTAGSLAALQNSPGYQFRFKEGQQALERSAAARGTLLTGGTLKGLTRYGQDYASGEYNNRYNQLMGYTNIGERAAGATANAGSNYANSAGELNTQIGNANAAGTVAQTNAWTGAVNQGVNNAAQMYYLNRLFGSGAGGG